MSGLVLALGCAPSVPSTVADPPDDVEDSGTTGDTPSGDTSSSTHDTVDSAGTVLEPPTCDGEGIVSVVVGRDDGGFVPWVDGDLLPDGASMQWVAQTSGLDTREPLFLVVRLDQGDASSDATGGLIATCDDVSGLGTLPFVVPRPEGLATGPVQLSVTVTDAEGDVATYAVELLVP